MDFLKAWPDLLWLLPALFLMERGKRMLTCGYVLASVLLLRLQVEFFTEMGWERGFFRWLDSGVLARGLCVYGIFTGLFLALAYFSPGSDKNVHLAASITMMILAFCVSFAVMVL